MGKRLILLTEDVEELKNELSELQVGDRFIFGNYPAPVEWRVLDKTSDSLFVISERALDTKPFDKEGETNNWDSCSLKKWLNSEFFNKAFDSEEKSLIENTSVGRVFCLSREEAEKYFSSNSDRRCRVTRYALSQEVYTYQGDCCWWLRSPGIDYDHAILVTNFGTINCLYGKVDDAGVAVRPAMRLRI